MEKPQQVEPAFMEKESKRLLEIQGIGRKTWAKIKESLSNLKEMIFDQVKSWLITTIVKKAMLKLATATPPPV